MRDCVQIDVRGHTHVDFEDTRLVLVKKSDRSELFPVRVKGRRILTHGPMAYSEIQWIGGVVRRQWWLLAPSVFFTLMGPLWAIADYGNWAPFIFGICVSVVFGLVPLAFFMQGRTYLGIATADKILIFPMDRKKKRIARILGLLRQACTSPPTEWELEGTRFSHPDSWDNRPATGVGFNWKRYRLIGFLVGVAELLIHGWIVALVYLAILSLVLLLLWGYAYYRTRRAVIEASHPVAAEEADK